MDSFTPWGSTMSCLLPPLGCQIAANSFRPESTSPSFLIVSTLLTIDTCFYLILAWYLSEVFPSKNGVTKPLNFICKNPSLWSLSFFRSSSLQFQELPTRVHGDTGHDLDNGDVEMNPIQITSSTESVNNTNSALDLNDETLISNGLPSENSQRYIIETVHASEPISDADLRTEPSVRVSNLRKTFSGCIAVNHLSIDLYENQIFALLGHNGAGKTTLINMLIGLTASDDICVGDATVYGNTISSDIEYIRRSLGVCTQQDVLFPLLTVYEHLILALSLKGVDAPSIESEAEHWLTVFNLVDCKLRKTPDLSGGEKRKLGVAMALCGGSKFIVLDEPTAGMDVDARRKLWDLLTKYKQDKTILLTTHFMDEAEVLGDRVGIMAKGKMQTIGSVNFLKLKFGSGYRIVLGRSSDQTEEHKKRLSHTVTTVIPSSCIENDESDHTQLIFRVPYNAKSLYSNVLRHIEAEQELYGITSIGVTSGSLDEVFFKLGGEECEIYDRDETASVLNRLFSAIDGPISGKNSFSYLISQIYGIIYRKLKIAQRDTMIYMTTVLILFLTLLAGLLYNPIETATIQYMQNNTDFNSTNYESYDSTLIEQESRIVADIFAIVMYYIMFFGVCGMTGDFIVRERCNKLRSLLTLQGCSSIAYWIGNFIADFSILLSLLLILFASWRIANMKDFLNKNYELLTISYIFQLISFSYAWSFIFTSNKSSVSTLTVLGSRLALVPIISITLGIGIYSVFKSIGYPDLSTEVTVKLYLWGVVLFSPQYGYLIGLLNVLRTLATLLPSASSVTIIMLIESTLFLLYSYHLDNAQYCEEEPKSDIIDRSILPTDSPDVKEETISTKALARNLLTSSSSSLSNLFTHRSYNSIYTDQRSTINSDLIVDELRKVYPSEFSLLQLFNSLSSNYQNQRDINQYVESKLTVAVENITFNVRAGEIFGLLGSNGAGKSTTISMISRDIIPTSGNAYISYFSILRNFLMASSHLGIVFQTNALWNDLTVEEHIVLFCRLRGVKNDDIPQVTPALLTQLQLLPHRGKLISELSGGMKRKLCVVIALIGNPRVILLDEPCAGLDPLSRRNLRSLIMACAPTRAVVLTTHSMDEADALCNKISIMSRGRIRALGTRQSLKSSLGLTYEVNFNFHDKCDLIQSSRNLIEFLTALFPSTCIVNQNGRSLRCTIFREEVKLSVFFQEIESVIYQFHIEYYSIDQPSLEQVFVNVVESFNSSDTNRDTSGISNSIIPVTSESDDLYYTGKFNSFGCTKYQLVVLIGTCLVTCLMTFTLSFVLTEYTLILFSISYISLLLLIIIMIIAMWTYRRLLIPVT